MEKSILKTIGKCVIFGIIWGIVLFGVALIITNFKDYELRDVLFVEGLKHNLLSISQLCNKEYQVMFKTNTCEICLPNTKELMLVGKRVNNVYLLDISSPCSIGCLLSKQDES